MKKAIIFDCDNTLWAGVIGEGSVTPFHQLQWDIIFLAEHGVIIGLCSKNNEADVMAQLKNQPLTEAYIAVHRINWQDKVTNLKEIAAELNIGLDSIVFVDDSDFEVNLVNRFLPEVMAIYPAQLMKIVMQHFNLTGDITKTEQYKANYNRAKTAQQFTNIDEYLASLDMHLKFKVNDLLQVPRIAELTQKTNQFNLTCYRYTETDIAKYMRHSLVYSLSVTDKFGDNGLVGVSIVRGNCLDTFLLSCRVLGRNVEWALLDKVIEHLIGQGYQGIIARHVPSDKNQQVTDFYSRAGFECVDVTEGAISFSLILYNYKMKAPKYFVYE
jgi:FkbH-like protein